MRQRAVDGEALDRVHVRHWRRMCILHGREYRDEVRLQTGSYKRSRLALEHVWLKHLVQVPRLARGDIVEHRHVFGMDVILDARKLGLQDFLFDLFACSPRLPRAVVNVDDATRLLAKKGGQDKFSQDARGMLEYGSLKVFFGGLEGLVGSPNPNVMAAMAEEHTAGVDGRAVHHAATTSRRTLANGVRATLRPPPTGWPVEQKIRAAIAGGDGDDLADPSSSGAQPESHCLYRSRRRLVRQRAGELGEREMTLVEAIGLREYTGPLFVKYNAVLRGLNSKVGFLQTQLAVRRHASSLPPGRCRSSRPRPR